jgi:hypothetical protein
MTGWAATELQFADLAAQPNTTVALFVGRFSSHPGSL